MRVKNAGGNISICLLICLSFLWTGCGYLSWFYHLTEYYDAHSVDMLTEVIGYLFQAAGIIIFAVYEKQYAGRERSRYSYALMSLAGLTLTALASLSPSGPVSLVFGYGMNTLFGMIAGFYLSLLAGLVQPSRAGIVFGAGYGIGSILSYLISLIGGGSFLSDPRVFIIYSAIYIITVPLSLRIDQEASAEAKGPSAPAAPAKLQNPLNWLWIPGITVLLLSCVKSGGFYFSATDLGDHNISLELSRSFYAAGLIAAGLVNDRKRSAGAVLCIAALVFPFFTIIAGNNADINYLLWILNYVFFGFYAVYRVLLFIDISHSSSELAWIACLGLMWGRLGDAAGAAAGITLSGRPVTLLTLMAILFVLCIFLFFHLYHMLYMRPAAPEPDFVQTFAARYDLSQRETDIVRLLLDGCTNKEIAEHLFITENTVKFHMRNLLRKTGCSRRKELLALFESIRSE